MTREEKSRGKFKLLRKRMSMVSLTIIVIAVLSVLAYVQITEIEEQKCWNFMKESAQAVNNEIDIRISDNVNILRLTSDQLVQESLLDDMEATKTRLRSMTRITMFYRIDILYSDGTLLTPMGVREDTSSVPPYAKLAEMGTYMSQRVRDIVKDEPVMRYYIPIKEDSKTVAIMIGVIDCTSLYKTFNTAACDGNANCYLVDSDDGAFIMGQKGETLGNVSGLRDCKLRKDYENIDLPTEIRRLRTGAVAYEVDGENQDYFMYYTPVGLFDWELLMVVREDIAFASLIRVKHILFIVALCEAFLLTLYFFWNIHFVKLINKSKMRAEKELMISTTLLQSIRALSSHSDTNRAIDELLEIICTFFEGDRAYISTFDYEKETTSNKYEYAAPGVTKEMERLQNIPLDMVELWIKKFTENGMFYLSNVDKIMKANRPAYDLLRAQNIRSLVAVPLMEEDVIIGFFGVDNPKKNYYDLSLMSSAAFFITDSMEKRERNELLNRLSFEDSLTGLNNRNKYNQILDKYGDRIVRRTGTAFFDLNGLKRMNDTYGHEAGDELIRNAAKHIWNTFEGDAFRIGGDEFTVVMIGVDQYEFEQKVKDTALQMKDDNISIATGMSWHDGDITLTAQLQEADAKMYLDKQRYYHDAEHR